jgi:hypothetical protein
LEAPEEEDTAMSKSAIGLAAILVLGLYIGGQVLAQGARAQTYPPPVGSLSAGAASTITPGATTNVTGTVLDSAGNPVAGATVIFRIVSQPDSDAHWLDGGLETTAITEADGVATAVLMASTTPGNIIIETLSGGKTSQVTVVVQEEAEVPIDVPETGGTPTEGSAEHGLAAWQIALLAIGAGVLSGGFAIMIRRNKKA